MGNEIAPIELYRKWKKDTRECRKLPKLRRTRGETSAELADDAAVGQRHHDHVCRYSYLAIGDEHAIRL